MMGLSKPTEYTRVKSKANYRLYDYNVALQAHPWGNKSDILVNDIENVED